MSVSQLLHATALLLAVSFSQSAISEHDDRQRIHELIADYGWYADSRDVQSYLGLFTPDAAFVAPKLGLSLNGQQEISAFIGPRWKKIAELGEQRRHIITGIRLTNVSEKSASYRAILNLAAKKSEGETKIVMTGFYVGTLTKTAAGWRIARL